MINPEIESIIAVILSAGALLHTIRKSRKEEQRAVKNEERAVRDDQRLKSLEQKQKEEEERRFRADAPFFVPVKVSGGTQNENGQDIWRLIICNNGVDARNIEVYLEGIDLSIRPKHALKGDKIELIYPARMFKEGTVLEFEISFETSNGYQAKHKYEFKPEEVYLRRTHPKK